MQRICTIGFLALLCFSLSAARAQNWAEGGIVSVRLQPLAEGEAKLIVELASAANLTLYYDSQPPKNEDILETFWFRERSEARSVTHTFALAELIEGKEYVFRLVCTWPDEKWSPVMRWKIPAKSKEVIVIK